MNAVPSSRPEHWKILRKLSHNRIIVVYVDTFGKEHQVAMVRGYTYKHWVCYITGIDIPLNPLGNRKSKGWAWRIDGSKDPSEGMVRIHAPVFDKILNSGDHVAEPTDAEDVPRDIPIDHELKCWPGQFKAIRDGKKTHEVRKNDRNYRVGDNLLLHEWIPEQERYTGESERMTVTYITKGGPGSPSGLPADLVVMSIKPI